MFELIYLMENHKFFLFIEGDGEMIGCKLVNSLSNCPIPFRIWGGIFSLLFSHKTRGFRLIIDCGIMKLSYFIEGEGKGLGVGQSILYWIPQFIFVFKEVYLVYYTSTRREVFVHLLNGELRICHILLRGRGKDWV